MKNEKTEGAKPTAAPWDVVMVRADGEGWSFDEKKDWPCGVRYQIKDDDAQPITKEEAEANCALIKAAHSMRATLAIIAKKIADAKDAEDFPNDDLWDLASEIEDLAEVAVAESGVSL